MSDSELHMFEYKYDDLLHKASYFNIRVYSAIKENYCNLLDIPIMLHRSSSNSSLSGELI